MSLGSSAISLSQAYDEYREIRRSPAHRAVLSTVQKITSDLGAIITVTSYKDLLPLIWVQPRHSVKKINATPLVKAPSIEGENEGVNFKKKAFFAMLGVGALAALRFSYDYPYLWAAYVMKDAEWYCSQNKYGDANRVLIEAENSYCVAKAKPAIRIYADYVKCLTGNLKLTEDLKNFFNSLYLALVALKSNSYYSGIRNNLLLKKLEKAIKHQDKTRLNQVLEENPPGKIIEFGINFFFSHVFDSALRNQEKASIYLQEMKPLLKPLFSSSRYPAIDTLYQLLQTRSNSLQAWSQLHPTQAPLSPTKVKEHTQAIQEFQDFFKANVTGKGVYQQLQYYKLLISFVHDTTNEQTEAILKESEVEFHRQFSYALVLTPNRLLWGEERVKAMDMLQKADLPSFKDRGLIQSYRHFLSLSVLEEQIEALESCFTVLKKEETFDKELYTVFYSFKVALYLDAERYTDAEGLLAQESPHSKVHEEVAAYLFEKMNKTEKEKALNDLKKMIENLGSWHHLELFKAFRSYLLLCTPQASSEACLEALISLTTQLKKIDQLSHFALAYNSQLSLLKLKSYLAQGQFEEAKKLLTSTPRESYPKLYEIPPMFLVVASERLRQMTSLEDARDNLQNFFATPQSSTQPYIDFLKHLEARIQPYIDFLRHFEDAEKDVKEKSRSRAYNNAFQSLELAFTQIDSLSRDFPESSILSLKLRWTEDKIIIQTHIANLAIKVDKQEAAQKAKDLARTLWKEEIPQLKNQQNLALNKEKQQ